MTRTHSPEPAATFVFDGGCGFCAWSADWLAHLTAPPAPAASGRPASAAAEPSLAVVSSHDVDFAALGIEPTLIERHALYFEPRSAGPVFLKLGSAAIGFALRDHGVSRAWRAAGSVLLNPLVAAPAAIAYRLVAANRGRMGPLRKLADAALGAPPRRRR